MLVKIYWSIWALCAVTAILLFATGNFTMLTAVVFGFISFGLTFMGMMGVLPATIAHPAEVKPAKIAQATIAVSSKDRAKTFGVLKSA